MDHQTEQPADFSKLMSLAKSDAGRKLMDMLKINHTGELNRAVLQAQNGDFSQAKNIIQQLLENPEAEELIQELRGSL